MDFENGELRIVSGCATVEPSSKEAIFLTCKPDFFVLAKLLNLSSIGGWLVFTLDPDVIMDPLHVA